MDNKIEDKKIILFVDLLGFKNFVCDNEEKDLKKIESVLNIFSQNFQGERPYDLLFGTPEEVEKNISIFSDSVIISIEDKSQKQRYFSGIIEDLALQISKCQRTLFEHKILLRGGLTLGNIYHTKNMCFGSALIRAYELESKYAIYPRILIDNEIIELLKKEKCENFSLLEKSFISKDDKNLYFFDYAKQIVSHQESKDNFAGFADVIETKGKKELSKIEIIRLLDDIISNEKEEKVQMKYTWLRTQFDK